MLPHQFWVFCILLLHSSWLPGTNPSLSTPSSTPSFSTSSSASSSPKDAPSLNLENENGNLLSLSFASSSLSSLSSNSYLPFKQIPLTNWFQVSPPVLHPINDHQSESGGDDDDDGDGIKHHLNGSTTLRLNRFPRSHRNFGLQRVDFNIPTNVILGENTTSPVEYGPWSPWSEPSRCSRPCGGGIRSQKRFCTDTNAIGQSSCIGPDTRYYSCNIQPCSDPIDFRAQQCSMFNNQSIPLSVGRWENVEWEPYTSRSTDRKSDEDICALNCKPKNGTWYTKLMEQVIDGTKCLREMDWVSGACVAGNCLPVGCDGLLGSLKEEDKCRVCGGEGKDCNTVRDTFVENLPAGYQDIVLIPRGATYIRIQELGPSRNFLAVRDSTGRYYLNGHWTFEITLTDFEAGGTRFEYGKRPATSPTGAIAESLYALGPLRHPLYIQMVYQEDTPGIEYEYSVPSDVPVPSIWAPSDAYQYMLGPYGPCSRSCGSGVQIRPVRCVRLKTGEFVPIEFCKKEILPQLSRPCNQIDCLPAYHKGKWSECICPGIKTRAVFCEEIRGSGQRLVLDDSVCGNQPRPSAVAACPPNDCYELSSIAGNQTEPTVEYKWNTTEWSKCSARCGQGKHSREVICTNMNGTRVHESLCPPDQRPLVEEACFSVPCRGGVDWVTSEWSSCDIPCGPLTSTRDVLCVNSEGAAYDENFCGLERKPADRRNCPQNPGCNYTWFTSDWSSCSASCGRGIQTRNVICGLFDDDSIKVDEAKCKGKLKPISERTCRAAVPCKAKLYFGLWGPCQCGKEERSIFCLDVNNVTSSKLPLAQCNATTGETKKSQVDLTSNSTQIVSTPATTTTTTTTNNETLASNETLSETNATFINNNNTNNNSTSNNETTAMVQLTLLSIDRTCDYVKPGVSPRESVGGGGGEVPDVLPDSASGDSSNATGTGTGSVDCCASEFGCCPDNLTARKSDFSNCYKEIETKNRTETETETKTETDVKVDESLTNATTITASNDTVSATNTTETTIKLPAACLTSTYGCCWDGELPAYGPFKFGCPVNCNYTLFGCCFDNKTAKTNETGLNCPPKCLSTLFGCCDDNITEAGVNRTNCPIKPTPGPGDTDEIEGSGGNEICLEVEGSGDGDTSGNKTSSCTKPSKAKPSSVACTDGPNNSTVCSPVTKEPAVPCNTTTFGCCPDGLNARKSEIDDCTCTGSEFGCCPDNKTLATGLNQEGCPCSTFPAKCCQDDYTRATGPDYEGCVCSRMLYGCCADGITPARGPNQFGCGCNSTTFGCCPDNSTAASGSNYAGCPCRSLPHGCCPDQKTAAKGPNNEGCPCETLTHGCCFDGLTPATGPNYGGCDCTKAPWHCCPDYTTVALGPNYEGCPGGPSLDINRAPDACRLQRERGPCRNFTIKWYYDQPYGGCVRFWYGGCDGNANRFQSEEECEKICVNPDGYLRCNLPAVFGACGLNITKYHFNPETRSCETFQYSGCLGNKNNFNTRSECEAFCLHPETLDQCDQPMDRGHCSRKQTRYFYDRSTDSCQTFDWGGCGGNQNNFNTIEDCQRKCTIVKKDKPETLCYLPRSEGRCLGRYPRWFFDAVSQECREFIYTGCEGNHNRFVSKIDCEQMCNSTKRPLIPSSPSQLYPPMTPYDPIQGPVGQPIVDSCKLPVSAGTADCDERLVKWYHNDVYKKCIPFDYRGCGGNGNRFNSQEECENRCGVPPSSPQPIAPISLAIQPGPPPPQPGIDQCMAIQDGGYNCPERDRTFELRWSFDRESHSCARFYYSGCGGNANNFRSESECLAACSHHIIRGVPSPPQSPITSPSQSSSPLSPPLMNPQQPSSVSSPSSPSPSLSPPSPPSPLLPPSPPSPGWSDPSINAPSRPWPVNYDRYTPEANDIFSMASCVLPKDYGSGSDSMSAWYYDPIDGVCKIFYYTGYGGNTNRFVTRKECELKCWSSQDICRLPPIRGRCGGTYPVYYYDPSTRDCISFTYGGCEGNANRFDSLEECRLRCRYY